MNIYFLSKSNVLLNIIFCLLGFREEEHTCAHRWIYFLYYLLKTQQFVINTCSACAGEESKEMW